MWIKGCAAYSSGMKTGKQVQLVGYSFLYLTAIFFCLHLGTPKLIALADIQVPGAESIIISFSVGIFLVFVGEWLIVKCHLRGKAPNCHTSPHNS